MRAWLDVTVTDGIRQRSLKIVRGRTMYQIGAHVGSPSARIYAYGRRRLTVRRLPFGLALYTDSAIG
jgi:hypothetical protein